jgi:hypothetical protein
VDCRGATGELQNAVRIQAAGLVVSGDYFVTLQHHIRWGLNRPVTVKHKGEFFELFRQDSQKYSGIMGCYVTVDTLSLFLDYRHVLERLLLDATGKILRQSGPSVLILFICDVGAAVSLTFQLQETLERQGVQGLP